MWLAYADESYDDDEHWVIGLLVEDWRVNETHRAIRDVVSRASDAYGISADAELHGYDLFHGEREFKIMKEKPRARIALMNSVFRVIVDAESWIILRGVNKPRLEARYIYPEHPHRVTMAHLIERIDDFCNRNQTHSLLIADEYHETEKALLRDMVTYQDYGTWGYLAKKITCVIDTIHFVNSRTNPLVQAADMVAYLALRRRSHRDCDPRELRANAALWGVVEPRIRHQHCWYP
jgi:Protein of unknown function (DUF3800)